MNKILNSKNIIIIILLLLLVGSGWYFTNKNTSLNEELSSEIKLNEALRDSVTYFQTENGELGAEKRSLQGDLDKLIDENGKLSKEQKEFLNTIDRLNKKYKKDKEIFAAASIKYEKLIDSLKVVIAGATNVDTIKNTVSFVENDSSKDFIYNIKVIGVRPIPVGSNPNISFNELDFPNNQTISFNWDKNERKDYPVSFTVLNTNKYFTVQNIESYVIPELNKKEVNPNFWQKSWSWIKVNGKYVLAGGAGFAIGFMAQ